MAHPGDGGTEIWHECLRCGDLITLCSDGLYRHSKSGHDHFGVVPPEVREDGAAPTFYLGRTR